MVGRVVRWRRRSWRARRREKRRRERKGDSSPLPRKENVHTPPPISMVHRTTNKIQPILKTIDCETCACAGLHLGVCVRGGC